MPTLLIIDDEESVQYSLRYAFEADGITVLAAPTGTEGLALLEEHSTDAVLLDLQLPDRSGLDVFQRIQTLDPRLPVVFLTAHGTADSAIEAMKNGAFDYLVKPVELDRLTQIVDRAFEAARLMRVPAVLGDETPVDRIVGHSPIMQEMCKQIGRLAPQDVNVLILGESGTGKELVARALYQHSRRAEQPFLAINCAAIPEALLESELFGHEQGAFTGAYQRRLGKFEQCHKGTLFLDEIGDMPPVLQAKMLRVLQERCIERVGGNQTVAVNVRILAATNQDLERLVAEGRFRADLYYRLKGVAIGVPPLRDRREDIAELAHHFLFQFNRAMGLSLQGFAPETLERLHGYAWPGNVRELQGVVRQAMLRASGHILIPEFLPAEVGRGATPIRAGVDNTGPSLQAVVEQLLATEDADLYARAVEAMERVLLPRVLQHTHGNQSRASQILNMSRSTLRQKLRALGFAIDQVITGNEND